MTPAPRPLGPNGAELVLRTAVAAGSDVCFANPGTTEMQLVAALDAVPGMRSVLGLFEGVVTGAADGFGRMTGRAALTILHLGPGFANGIANLHNARRAASPVVNLVGDHATWHLAADAPLTSDIESLARPVGWVHRATSASSLGRDVADAIAAAVGPPARPATLILPQDVTWTEVDTGEPLSAPADRPDPEVDPDEVARAVAALSRGEQTVLYIGGGALLRTGLEAAARIQAATGVRVVTETFSSRIERGGGLPSFDALPYFPEQGVEALASFHAAVLVGADEPVAFFGYPDRPSRLLPDGCERIALAGHGMPAAGLLEALAGALDAGPFRPGPGPDLPVLPSGRLSPDTLGAAVAALQPEGAIVVNEAATSGLPWTAASIAAPHHDVLGLTGGAIGQGLPCAVGAAVACPDRPVIALQADGSGAYTLQALWTMAREELDVTVVVCANRAYRILQYELFRAGTSEPGPAAVDLMDLTRPTIDWAGLARSLGVPAASVDTAEQFIDELRAALATAGPHLIEPSSRSLLRVTATDRLREPVADLLHDPGTERAVSKVVTAESLALSTSRAVDGSSVVLDAVLEAMSGGITVIGTVTFSWTGECRRCLAPVEAETVAEVSEVFSRLDDDDTYPLGDDEIDLEPLLREAVLLNLPLAPLCSDDCRGPAPAVFPAHTPDDETGDPPIDPRWSALDDLKFD